MAMLLGLYLYLYLPQVDISIEQQAFHNWLEMQKVVTFPCFLMEHPVFIMYIQVMYMRKGKKEKKIFFGYARIRTRGTSITNFLRIFSTV